MPNFYVDPLFHFEPKNYRAKVAGQKWGQMWCHLWTDGTEAELIDFAESIGMKRHWIQRKQGFLHFDLVPSRRKDALTKGAVEKDLREWIEQRRYDQRTPGDLPAE